MFFSYLSDKKSWILFILLSLFATDLLLWLDPGIAVHIISLLYVNILLIFSLIVFCFWRYRIEMAYTRELALLAENPETDWIEALPEANSKHDEIINHMLMEAGISFSRQLNDVRKSSLVQGDYTAAWVHEAKAPLTAMKMLIDSNRDHPRISRIEAEWLRLYLLIDQQLYISRLPALESDYVLEDAVLQELVAAEVRELMSWYLEKNIAVDMEGLDQSVVTDKKWSRFILRQILSNAVKYSPGGGTIFISARVEHTGHTILSIRDEGPGIPLHDLPRIFDKGFTGSAGRLHNAATGIGLYVAKVASDKIGIKLKASNHSPGASLEMAFSLENEFDHIR